MICSIYIFSYVEHSKTLALKSVQPNQGGERFELIAKYIMLGFRAYDKISYLEHFDKISKVNSERHNIGSLKGKYCNH